MKLTHLKAICFSACSCSNISQIFLVYFWMNSCCTCLLAILRWGMMWRRSNFFAMNPRGTWRVAMWWALCRSLLDVFVLVESNVAATNLHCRFAEVCHCFGHKKLPPTIPNLRSEAQMIWKGLQLGNSSRLSAGILHPRTLPLRITENRTICYRN